jgi:hypothetical protein
MLRDEMDALFAWMDTPHWRLGIYTAARRWQPVIVEPMPGAAGMLR